MDSFTPVIHILQKAVCKCHDVNKKKKKTQKIHSLGVPVSDMAVDMSRMFHNVRRKTYTEGTF